MVLSAPGLIAPMGVQLVLDLACGQRRESTQWLVICPLGAFLLAHLSAEADTGLVFHVPSSHTSDLGPNFGVLSLREAVRSLLLLACALGAMWVCCDPEPTESGHLCPWEPFSAPLLGVVQVQNILTSLDVWVLGLRMQ